MRFSALKHFAKTGLASGTACALIMAPMLSAAQASTKVGVTSAVIPQALIGDTPDEFQVISVGDRVDQDVTIETGPGGRTQVLFVDGSSMNIGPNSRIIVDEFVFDPTQLTGNLGARIEKGSMRFIGGVLSKRSKQVEFDAGEATVGIRGGIAKVALLPGGALKAELVHGRLSVQTPEGLFETSRIGTLIERDAVGGVATRSVTINEAKQELDEEADQSLIEDAPANGPTPAAPTPEAASSSNPVDNGLVEIDESGNLKAAEALVEADPEAARLVDEGAIAVDESGNVAPTEKMLELDDTAKAMFDRGLIKVNEEGFLVPADDFDAEELYAEFKAEEPDLELVSAVTLDEFDFEEPDLLAVEASYIENRNAATQVLKNDSGLAEFYASGLVGMGEDGKLATKNEFKDYFTSRISTDQSAFGTTEKQTYVADTAVDKFLLDEGVFDVKETTRVLGVNLASSFYSAEVATVVTADIVRDDALNAIEKLASVNQVRLDGATKEQSLETLIAVGKELSGLDKVRSVLGPEGLSESGLEIEFNTNDKKFELKSRTATTRRNAPTPELSSRQIEALERQGLQSADISKYVNIGVVPPGFGSQPSFDEVPQRDAGLPFPTRPDLGATGELGTPRANVPDAPSFGSREPAFKPVERGFDDYAGGTDFSTAVEKRYDGISGIIKTRSTVAPIIVPVTQPAYPPGFGQADEPDTEASGGLTGIKTPTPVTPPVGIGGSIWPPTGPDPEDTVADTKDNTKQTNTPVDNPLYVSGMRRAGGTTVWGSSGPSGVWQAYNSDAGEVNVITQYPTNGNVFVRFEANTRGDGSSINTVAFEAAEPSGRISNVLAHGSHSFAAAMAAVAGATNAPSRSINSNDKIAFSQNRPASLRAASGQNFCDCAHVATGIWQDKSFADGALGRITYQHRGHYAVGTPDADLIQELAGQIVTFAGHAYADVTHVDGSSVLTGTGYGQVEVQLDFANRNDTNRNYWELTNFSSSDANYTSPTVRVGLTHEGTSGRYTGATATAQVDGGVHGTGRNDVETAGTFVLNDPGVTAVSGSYAAEATSVNPSN